MGHASACHPSAARTAAHARHCDEAAVQVREFTTAAPPRDPVPSGVCRRPTQRRPFSRVFLEPQRSQPTAKRCIFRVGCDFGDSIHIECGPRTRSGLVGQTIVFCRLSTPERFLCQAEHKKRCPVPTWTGDCIHIECGPRTGSGLVGNKKARDGPSHKDKFPKQRAQETRSDDELLTI